MRLISWCLLLQLVLVAGIQAQSDPGEQMAAAFAEKYPFFTMKDTAFSFEGEFDLPDGYSWPDSAKLTPYQSWISGFPLWHRHKPVGVWKGGKEFESKDISRVVHLPWKGPTFSDVGFPLYILAEYLVHTHREVDLAIALKGGDTFDYPTWLHSKETLSGLGKVMFRPSEPRDSSANEYYRFLNMLQRHSTYKSLATNCDSVAIKDVAPGDIFIGYNEIGAKGAVYFVLNMITNVTGERLYCVATGCPVACDFHIPLVNLDRDDPWITASRMLELVADYSHHGSFRWQGL
ncbi:MAG: hypothetical protein KOO62_12070 [candidate division Zixibacteria bacterium]|nr:hypothetical protein [candidate division Zixibacteria bacterium]